MKGNLSMRHSLIDPICAAASYARRRPRAANRQILDRLANKRLIATIAAALLTGPCLAASAQTKVAYTSDPINIVRYSLEPSYTQPIPVWGGTYMNIDGAGKVTISFVNSGVVPATSVQFALRSDKATELIVDKGTFSPGASIVHDFSSDFDSAAGLEVEQVTFADGTVWQR